MAKLAILGHATRGKEVIEILEMLGGKNKRYLKGTDTNLVYYINLEGDIDTSYTASTKHYKVFTLEEFLERYPYKVGDKTQLDEWSCVITEMSWGYDDVIYSVKGVDFSKRVCSKDLQPYKEETIEETDIMNHTTEINLNHPCFKGCDEIEIIIPDGWEFKQRDNKMFGVRKQYPKTYVECAKILKCFSAVHIDGYRRELLEKLQELIVCRDAYWKIAGEQMGLDKPWEPENPTKHYIFTIETCGDVIKNAITSTWWNRILVFPTEEMRDAFYENFKGLIEECKEFL